MAIKNRAAACEFGVNERFIREWRSKKASSKTMPKEKLLRRSEIAHWLELEYVLEKWIFEE